MRIYCLLVVAMLLLAGCATYQSEGLLIFNEELSFPYKHVAISPESSSSVMGALSLELKSKGYTVYKSLAFHNVVGIQPGNPILVFVCRDAGRTDRGGGWSQSVECICYDLHTKEIIYEGAGEYMGMSVAEDYRGATREALRKLPRVGSRGTITSIVELPHEEKRRTYGGGGVAEKERSRQGTGWLMPGRFIVTNQHVVDGAAEVRVVAYDGTEYAAMISIEDKANDLALLRFVENGLDYPAIPISEELAALGSDVFTLGFPMTTIMGTNPKFTSGKINSTSGIQNDPRLYQISVPVQAGNSGGPLLNTRGEAVGIVTSKLHAIRIFQWTGDLPQNVNYAIKTSYVIPLADHAGSEDVAILPSAEGTYEELVERIERSVFLIIAE